MQRRCLNVQMRFKCELQRKCNDVMQNTNVSMQIVKFTLTHPCRLACAIGMILHIRAKSILSEAISFMIHLACYAIFYLCAVDVSLLFLLCSHFIIVCL